MSLTTTLALTSAVLLIMLFAVFKICSNLQKENVQIKAELENEKKTVVEAFKYAEELAKIQKDKSSVNQKINEASTSEEISEIINNIIATNNAKLRK